MAITIDDIAKEANVSIATVSRVINGSKTVSPELRNRVMEAVNRNHFRPNTFARALTTNKSNIIGIIVTDISNPVISSLVKGIHQVCQERGFTVMICESGGNKDNEKALLYRMEEQHSTGVLLAGVDIDQESVRTMLNLSYPVGLGTQEANDGKHAVTTVIHDNVSAIADAVRFLYANGHRRIAFIGGPERDYSNGSKRLEGFRQAAEELSLEIPDSYILHGNFTYESGADCMRRLYEENTELPTAVMACSDLMAIGAISCAGRLGLRVPDDLSIMGVDDSDLARYFSPALTTVRIPYFDEGKTAANVLFDLVESGMKTTGSITHIPHKVIRRFTVKDIR